MPTAAHDQFPLYGSHIREALVLMVRAELLYLCLFSGHVQRWVVVMVQVVHLVVLEAFYQTEVGFV